MNGEVQIPLTDPRLPKGGQIIRHRFEQRYPPFPENNIVSWQTNITPIPYSSPMLGYTRSYTRISMGLVMSWLIQAAKMVEQFGPTQAVTVELLSTSGIVLYAQTFDLTLVNEVNAENAIYAGSLVTDFVNPVTIHAREGLQLRFSGLFTIPPKSEKVDLTIIELFPGSVGGPFPPTSPPDSKLSYVRGPYGG